MNASELKPGIIVRGPVFPEDGDEYDFYDEKCWVGGVLARKKGLLSESAA